MKRCIFGLLFSLCFLCSVFTLGNRENQITLNSGNNQVKQRIVSLVPSVTETLFALNAEKNIVARTDYCNWPEETSSIPSVGGFDGKSLSLEKIISFQPDLVCVATVMHDHLVGPLQQYGIEVFVSSADSISSVKEEIIQLAKLTNKEQEGKDLIKKNRPSDSRSIKNCHKKNSSNCLLGNIFCSILYLWSRFLHNRSY